jgi:transcriptional regulator with XRE-family HTH domain
MACHGRAFGLSRITGKAFAVSSGSPDAVLSDHFFDILMLRSRPTELTPDSAERAIAARKRGLSLEKCAARIAVTRQTIHNWLQRGEAEHPPESDAIYVDFAIRFREAESDRQEKLIELAEIEKNGSGVRLLELSFPLEFGARATTVHELGTDTTTQDAASHLLALIARIAPAEGAREDCTESQPE